MPYGGYNNGFGGGYGQGGYQQGGYDMGGYPGGYYGQPQSQMMTSQPMASRAQEPLTVEATSTSDNDDASTVSVSA